MKTPAPPHLLPKHIIRLLAKNGTELVRLNYDPEWEDWGAKVALLNGLLLGGWRIEELFE